MRSLVRRLAPITLAALLVASLAPSVAAAEDTSSAAISAAEKAVLELTNKQRTQRGLVALRWDSRVAELARERSQYMAKTGEFSHTQGDGSDVFDKINDSSITWYGAGEIIAWNTAAQLDYSAAFAVQGWLGSAPHKAILLSKDYNYVGFGLAISSSGKRYWTGVYLKGPDRTGAWSKIKGVGKTVIDSKTVKVTVSWAGGDNRLQVLTAGLNYFQAQRRRPGGEWYTYDTTTATSLTRVWTRGVTYEFRVRARDKKGNWSGWQAITVTG